MPRENYAATVGAWRQFLDSVDEEIAQMPYAQEVALKLETMYGRAQELVLERAALQAAKQAATRDLQEILVDGRIAINYIRKALRYKLGKENPQLVRYGIQPYRRRKRSKKEMPAETDKSP